MVCQIVNNALANRCPETRTAYARVVKAAVLGEETTANLEDVIRQVEGIREKDILFMRAVKNMMDCGRALTGMNLSMWMSGKGNAYDSLECELMLYRFEGLGLLDHPREMMTKRGMMPFNKLPLFDKMVSYLSL